MTGKAVAGTLITLKQGGTTVASATTGADGSYSFANVAAGTGYTVAASASIYLESATVPFAVSGNNAVGDITLERVWPTAGTLVAGSMSGASGSSTALLYNPTDIAFGPDGILYIADRYNNKIRKVSPGSQTISDYAGTGAAGSANNTLAAATLNGPSGLCFAPNGDLYVAEYTGHRIRKIAGDQVSTVAGTGSPGNVASGTVATTPLSQPYGLAFINGQLYFSNYGSHRIQRLNGGNIELVAGDGTENSDGDGSAALAAKVKRPVGLALGTNGGLYFAEYTGHKIRMIDTTGDISTVTGSYGNGPTQLNNPCGVEVDAAGTLYIADYNNHRIVMKRGQTSTVLAGDGTAGTAPGRLYRPEGLAIGPDGYLYVADTWNHRIMRY